jgi:hypothetical protein
VSASECGAASSCHTRTGHDTRHGKHVRGLRWQGCVGRRQAVMAAAAACCCGCTTPHAALQPWRLYSMTPSCKIRRKCGAAAAPKAPQGGHVLIHWKRGWSQTRAGRKQRARRPPPCSRVAKTKQKKRFELQLTSAQCRRGKVQRRPPPPPPPPAPAPPSRARIALQQARV